MEALKFTSLKDHKIYDLILADPPFFKDDIYKVVENILSYGYLANNGFIYIERSIQTKQKDVDNLNHLRLSEMLVFTKSVINESFYNIIIPFRDCFPPILRTGTKFYSRKRSSGKSDKYIFRGFQ